MFRLKRIFIVWIIQCCFVGVVCSQSGNQTNNEKARDILNKMLTSRSKMKNLQFEYENIVWRNLNFVENPEYLINPDTEKIYAKHRIALDCNGLEKNDYYEYGIVDSSDTKVPVETLLRDRAWDGQTGVEHNHHGESAGSAILSSSPPYSLKNEVQPWRVFTGAFIELLAKTIDENSPVRVETLPDRKYQVSLHNSNDIEYVGIIDPSKGFTCSNMKVFNNDGTKDSDLIAEYEEFADGVWFPVTGEIVNMTNSGVVRRSIFNMSNIKVNNPNFSEDLFHIDLPIGTHVTDKVQGIKYVVVGPSLMAKALPELTQINPRLNSRLFENKRILVFFWDMQQRPSRNCMMQLSKRAKELKSQDVEIIAVHASKIDKIKLNEWLKENNVIFSRRMIQSDDEQIPVNWGVKSLPWLILTDKNHIVTAEGFPINDLDEKINELK